jgi:hypothetical protein
MITFRLVQRALASHHAGTSFLTQLLNSGNRNFQN